MNNRGVALILSFILIAVLTVLGAASLSRSIFESRIAGRYSESTQAFWLAEAGINRALNELRDDYTITSASDQMGAGRYEVDVSVIDVGTKWLVTSRGCIPDVTCNSSRTQRIIEATMTKVTSPGPDNFFNNAVYTPGNVDITGSAYSLTGDVRYGGTITPNNPPPANSIHDTSITDLARFDFDQLRAMSIDQGNYHDATHNPAFPTSFWHDQDAGIPNIVFIEGNFDISGGNQIVGGFVIVGGDLIYNTAITGNAAVDGVIYTLGTCSVLGGGNAPFNVNGGIWAGQGVTITGSTVINYNSTYMNAIDGLDLIFTVQISNWKDTQNSYELLVPVN